MKLKALFFTLALALTANLTANAQDSTSTTGTYNEEDCKKFRSLYYQYLKQKMYADACTFWSKAVASCGDSLDGKFYKNGRVAYLKLLKSVDETDEARKNEINDTIMWIYEQRISAFDHILHEVDSYCPNLNFDVEQEKFNISNEIGKNNTS